MRQNTGSTHIPGRSSIGKLAQSHIPTGPIYICIVPQTHAPYRSLLTVPSAHIPTVQCVQYHRPTFPTGPIYRHTYCTQYSNVKYNIMFVPDRRKED
jgi:hypothetical protein